jgi:hypothetical protein
VPGTTETGHGPVFGVFGVSGEDLRSSTGGFDLGVATGRGRSQVRDSSSIQGSPALAYRVLQDHSSPSPPHHTALTRKGQQPMSKIQNDPFATIDSTQLEKVAGGASRVSSRTGGSNDQLMTMLTQVTDSIKDLAKNQSSGGMDPMMMMMMMMGGGGGGGGAAAAAPAPAPAPTPAINISVKSRG